MAVADGLIALAYFSIPLELIWSTLQFRRSELGGSRVRLAVWLVVALFVAFILLCGLTHLVAIVVQLNPSPTALVCHLALKLCTGVVSVATAVSLVWLVPLALTIPLRTRQLEHEVSTRLQVESTLQREYDVLAKLREITQAIRLSLHKPTVLRTTTEQLCATLQLSRCPATVANLAHSPTIPLPGSVDDSGDAEDESDLDLQPLLAPPARPPTANAPGMPIQLRRLTPSIGAASSSTGGHSHTASYDSTANEDALGLTSLAAHLGPVLQSSQAIVLPAGDRDHGTGDAPVFRIGCRVRQPGAVIDDVAGTAAALAPEADYAVLVVEAPRAAWTGEGERLLLKLLDDVAAQVEIALEQAHQMEVERMRLDQLAEQNLALQRARQEVQAAGNRMQFLTMMSHEIRTPMYAVVALADVLLASGGLSADQSFMVETLKRSGDHLVTITNDLLDYSKYESGRLQLEKRPLSLRQCLENAFDLVSFNRRLNAPVVSPRTNLNYFIDEEVPDVVVGDATRLLQLFNNLLSNAAKFTEEGDIVVTVSVAKGVPSTLPERQPSRPSRLAGRPPSSLSSPEFARRPLAPDELRLVIVVADTGCGIPNDRIPFLFDRFMQADLSTTRRYGGTGLGLAICHSLASLMEGHISVESQVGRGSTFTLDLVVGRLTANAVQMYATEMAFYAPAPPTLPSSGAPRVSPPAPADAHEDGGISVLAYLRPEHWPDGVPLPPILAARRSQRSSEPVSASSAVIVSASALDSAALAALLAHEGVRSVVEVGSLADAVATLTTAPAAAPGDHGGAPPCLFILEAASLGAALDSETALLAACNDVYRLQAAAPTTLARGAALVREALRALSKAGRVIVVERREAAAGAATASQSAHVLRGLSTWIGQVEAATPATPGRVADPAAAASGPEALSPSTLLQDELVTGILHRPIRLRDLQRLLHAVCNPRGKPSSSLLMPATSDPSLVLEQRAPAPASVGAAPMTLGVAGGRALVVDDNEINLIVTTRLLGRLGLETETVTSGRDAIDLLRARALQPTLAPLPVVFLDVSMPVLDGMETTRILRSTWPSGVPSPYIIALTANSSEGDRQQCLSAGMDDFLGKPVKLDGMQRALDRYYATTRPSQL